MTAWTSLPRRLTTMGLTAALVVVPTAVGATTTPTPDVSARVGDAHRFNTWSGYPSGSFPEGVATGDFDGDGSVDVAYARHFAGSQNLTVQLNLGDGTMGPATAYASSARSTDIKAGDLDGDEDLDLVVTSEGTTYQNSII